METGTTTSMPPETAAERQPDRRPDEMMAMLAHELRGPLAPILSGLQLLRSRGESAAVCGVIERQVRHLAHLVDDMLDIAQISRGKVTLRSRALDLREVVGNAIEMASPLLEQKHHRLVLRMPADRLILDGDEMRLSQVVANLLTNAAKYTSPEAKSFWARPATGSGWCSACGITARGCPPS